MGVWSSEQLPMLRGRADSSVMLLLSTSSGNDSSA